MSEDTSIVSTDSDLMNRSEYDKVIFHDVADSYATDNDIQCQYNLTASVIPTEGDKVALFKVGWESPNLFLACQPATIPEDKEQNSILSVIFKAEDLPKDDEVFYQFCYVCADGVIRGASTPFRFRHPATEELVEIEDTESDLLIIRTRTAVIEERLREVAFKNSELAKSKANLEKMYNQKNEEYGILLSQFNQHQCEYEAFKKDSELAVKQYQQNLEELCNKLKDEKNKVAEEATSHHSQMIQNDAYIQELRSTIKLLSEEKEIEHAKSVAERKEKELLQKSLLTVEENLKKMTENNELLKQELDKTVMLSQKQSQTLVSQEYETHRRHKEWKEKFSACEREKKRLMNQLLDTENMLAAMEKSKHLATDEVMKYADYKKRMTKEIDGAQNRISILEEQMKILEEEKKHLITEKDYLQKDYKVLEEKLSTLQKNFETINETKQNLETDKESYNLLVNNLTDRLKAGAAEYQTKYIECMKLEKKLEKIKKKFKESANLKNDTSDNEVKNSENTSSSDEKPAKESVFKLETSIENLLTEKNLRIKLLEEKIESLSKTTLPSQTYTVTPPPLQEVNSPMTCGINYSYPLPSQNPKQYPQGPFFIRTFPGTPVFEIVHPPPTVNGENSTEVSEQNADDTQVDVGLPPPMQPEITSLAKLAAVTAVSRQIVDGQDIQGSSPSPRLNECSAHNDSDVECDGPGNNYRSPVEDPYDHRDEYSRRRTTFKCPFCNEYFPDYAFIHTHIDTIHLEQECPICNMPFPPHQQVEYERHVQEHFIFDQCLEFD